MPEFVQRTTAPDESNAYYYADNPFYQSGYGLPNCTCYAWGRFYELSGTRPTLCLRNAENWYGYSDGYSRGQTPRLGAVICWRRGVAGDDSDGAGHVAIVEQINADGSIVTSNSAYGSTLFYRQTLTKESGYTWNSAYTFQGFIYNPVNFDGGSTVIPTPISANRFLTEQEMQNNATYIYYYLSQRGWTMNAVAGMLGNMETESTINPGIWQNLNEGVGPAFGLVQWDPFTKYTNWSEENGLEPSEMDSALKRIEWELENGEQYYPTTDYPETFAEFKVSTADPYYLGMAFLRNYERPADPDQTARGTQAEKWYAFLSGLGPFTPSTTKKKRGYNFVLFGNKPWRKRQWQT